MSDDRYVLQWVVTLEVNDLSNDTPEQANVAYRLSRLAQKALSQAAGRFIGEHAPHFSAAMVAPVYAERPWWAADDDAHETDKERDE